MKVFYYCNFPSPYYIGFLDELAKLCELTVVFERSSSSERDSSWKKFNVANIQHLYILHGIHTKVDMAFCPQITRYLKKDNFDAFIIHDPASPTGMWLIGYMKLHKIPYILQSEGGIAKDGKGLKEKIKKYILSGASLYLSGMKIEEDYFAFYGAPKEKIKSYPFSSLYKKDLADKVLSPEEKKRMRNELGIQAECMIIYVGQFIYRKGIDILLNACLGMPESVSVLIIGGKPTEEYCEIIQKNNIQNVHFLDFMSKEKLLEYYRASDLFVLPTREDTYGLVINEAMSQGLAVITTDKCVAGLKLINDYENGFIVPVDNVVALSEKMKYLIDNPELRYKMGCKNLEKMQDYTFENMARVLYNTILKS